MKKGTEKLLKAYYFIINQVIIKINGDNSIKQKINEAFKAFYRREYGSGHTSLLEFERDELNELINRILIEFSVEYGIYLLQPNDPNNAEEMSLAEYLEHKDWNMDNDNFTLSGGIKKLPEGFTLINNIGELKTLKKGKRKVKPENMTFKFGKTLYLYSGKHNLFYKKILSTYTPIELLEKYIKLKIVYGTVN